VTEAQKAYAEQWPNHCRECGGWGYTTGFMDPSPSGAPGYGGVPWADVCTCAEAEQCARCGGHMGGAVQIPIRGQENTSERAVCVDCGFVEGETSGMPPDEETPEDIMARYGIGTELMDWASEFIRHCRQAGVEGFAPYPRSPSLWRRLMNRLRRRPRT